MKLLQLIFRNIKLFLLGLTSKGRKKVMYDTALENMKEARTLSILEKRILKGEVNFYVNRCIKRKRLTPFHLTMLVEKKFGEQLKAGKLKWHYQKMKIVDA